MSKRHSILFLSILAILASSVVFYTHRSSQLSRLIWKGKPAAYWIGRLSYWDLPQSSGVSAEEFLFEAGPEVVPQLIQGLSRKDNRLSDQWTDLYFKLGRWQRLFQVPIKRAAFRANCARGLGLLGQAASNAVPALLRALGDKDPWVRSATAEALGRIGADKERVAPELVAGLSSQDSNYRLACAIGLTHCLPGSPETAQALRALLVDPDSNLRGWAAGGLWRDDTDQAATYAALVAALRDPNATVRDRAAQSLGKMNFDEVQRAEALHAALETESRQGGNEIVLWKILTSLAQVGPAARPVIPKLMSLSQTNNHAATLSIIALGSIEPENPRWIEQLVSRLGRVKEGDAFWAAWELGKRGEPARGAVGALHQLAKGAEDWRTRVMAAAAAWRLDSSSPNPLNLITNQLSLRDNGQYEIVRLLGELGPVARPAVPTLRRLRYSHGIMMHDYANETLQTVAPEYLVNPWRE